MSHYPMRKTTELSYRTAAVDSASPIGLHLALYDTLSGDLRRAIEALHRNDIQSRCSELNHAFTVLAHLESWSDGDRPQPLAESLAAFYAHLRAEMLEASIQQSAPKLQALVELVLQIRTAWQEREALSQKSKAIPSHFTAESSPAPTLPARRIPLSQTA